MSEEVLLAWEMNGEPLPLSHGAPLRLVVTGYIGARSCKWVTRINALAEASMGPVQRQEYLYYTAQVTSPTLFRLIFVLISPWIDWQAKHQVFEWICDRANASFVRIDR